MTPIVLELPLKLVSEANMREHPMVRARRAKEHKRVTWMAVAAALRGRQHAPPYRVTITRVGAKRLDSDNLAGAGKHCRDAVAEALGIDDGDEGPGGKVTWLVEQECRRKSVPGPKGGVMAGIQPYSVRIVIEAAP